MNGSSRILSFWGFLVHIPLQLHQDLYLIEHNPWLWERKYITPEWFNATSYGWVKDEYDPTRICWDIYQVFTITQTLTKHTQTHALALRTGLLIVAATFFFSIFSIFFLFFSSSSSVPDDDAAFCDGHDSRG